MSADTWALLWILLLMSVCLTPAVRPLLRSRSRKDPSVCHKSKHTYNWAEYSKCPCGRRPNNWVHWPERLEPHKFKPHIRRDIGAVMKWCELCNKHERFKMHKLPLPIAKQVAELEKWHLDFRKKHPEFEDHTRNELFPELLEKE